MTNQTEKPSIDTGRRDFLKRGGLTGVATAGAMAAPSLALAKGPGDCVELPPEHAETFNTTCQYCMVQCGYKVKIWERGTGRKPIGAYTGPLTGEWLSPSMVVPAGKGAKRSTSPSCRTRTAWSTMATIRCGAAPTPRPCSPRTCPRRKNA